MTEQPVKAQTLTELANALGIAVQSRFLSTEVAGSVFKKQLRGLGLMTEDKIQPPVEIKKRE